MPYNHEKINILDGGWYIVFNDGSVITEQEMSWIEVPNKRDIKLMGLKRHNKQYEIEGKENYIAPGETHYREIIVSPPDGHAITKQSLIGWFIGYCDKEGKTILRVSAIDRSAVMEVMPNNTSK